MAFLPGNQENIYSAYLLCKLLRAGAVCGAAGVWHAMTRRVCDAEPEPQPAPGKEMPKEESIKTFTRLDSVSILCALFLTCTFLLF